MDSDPKATPMDCGKEAWASMLSAAPTAPTQEKPQTAVPFASIRTGGVSHLPVEFVYVVAPPKKSDHPAPDLGARILALDPALIAERARVWPNSIDVPPAICEGIRIYLRAAAALADGAPE